MWHVIWHGQEHVLHPLLGGQGPVDVEDAQTLLWHHPSLGRLYAWGVSIYRSTSCSLDHSKLTHCWNQQTYSFCQKKVFLNTMASWLGWCIHVLLFVGLPLQKNSTSHNMITRQPAKPHKLVRLLAVELAECKQHHKVSDTWTGWPGRPCTESLTDLRNCHSIGQNWEEQNANAFNIIQSFYRFSNFKNWKKITHKDPWETVTTEMQERINICCKSDSEYTAVSIKYAHLTSKAYQAYHGCIKPRRHKFWKAVELRMHHHVATSHPCLQNSLCKPWI